MNKTPFFNGGRTPFGNEGEGECRSLKKGAVQREREEPFVKEPFIKGGSLSLREGSRSVREGAILQERGSRSSGEGAVLREGAVLWERELFFKGGGCSSKEGAVLQRREDEGWGTPFFKGGRTPFINEGRRTLFFKPGTMLFVKGGSTPFAKEGTQFVDEGGCCLLKTRWWEGRTMNFHVGKFKVQHK